MKKNYMIFQTVCISIGNPNQVKELVGLKENTKFVSVGKKSQNESAKYLECAEKWL